MDHILERLNFASSRITEDHMDDNFKDNVSAFINLRTMKLHDINKEIEYNQMSQSMRQVQTIVPLLWSSVILFAGLFFFKVANSILEAKYNDGEGRDKTAMSSSTLGSTAETSYFEFFQSALSLGVIYAI